MAIVENQRVVVGPLASLNEMMKGGVDEGLAKMATQWNDVKSRAASDDWQFDMGSFDGPQLDHIKQDWLGVGGDSWFPGVDAAPILEKGFAHAIAVAGDRPVASLWVPAPGLDHVTVSVIENPTSVVVVLTSPMPPDGAKTSGPDANVTEFSTADG